MLRRKLKVSVRFRCKCLENVRVTGYDGKTVTTSSDLSFDSATVIWTVGVQGALPHGLKADSFIKM